ncbi:hypothetical protein PV326_001232, partial [Microctonus aethiopoides]
IATQSNTIQQTIKYIMFAGAQIMHLFFDCYLSQRLADNSSAIEEHIIHSKWNKTSLKTQKLVILVTLRSQQICKLTAGKFVILSMETFGVSYYKPTKYVTSLIGLWPYKERRRKIICRFITIFLCMSQFFAE